MDSQQECSKHRPAYYKLLLTQLITGYCLLGKVKAIVLVLSDYHILVSACNDVQTVAVTTHAVQDIPSEKRLGSLSSFLQRGAEAKGEGQRPSGRGRGRERQEQVGISVYVCAIHTEGARRLPTCHHLSCNRRLKY